VTATLSRPEKWRVLDVFEPSDSSDFKRTDIDHSSSFNPKTRKKQTTFASEILEKTNSSPYTRLFFEYSLFDVVSLCARMQRTNHAIQRKIKIKMLEIV